MSPTVRRWIAERLLDLAATLRALARASLEEQTTGAFGPEVSVLLDRLAEEGRQ